MSMEVHIYSSIKAIVATDIVKDIVTAQKGQSRSTRDIKIYIFFQKIQQGALGPRESTAWLRIYLWEYTQKVATSSL